MTVTAPLDADRIARDLARPFAVTVLDSVESTNSALAAQAWQGPRALLAETQTAGRGRRGRQWLSPPGAGLYLSLAWRPRQPPEALAPLGLVAGLAAVDALIVQGLAAVRLKWPNDLVVGAAKLGGCLVDLGTGPATSAVIGIGINVDLGGSANVDQPWTDLARLGVDTDRNRLAAALIDALVARLQAFDQRGFAPLKPDWAALDALRGLPLKVMDGSGQGMDGVAGGIDDLGRLRLISADGERLLSAGEISVRRA